MSMWLWIIAVCLAGYATKFVGYLVPEKVLQNERVLTISSMVTIGLLASLVTVNTFASGASLTFDARVAALGCAAVALLMRAPFIVVVILGAVGAALARLLGMP